MISYEIKAKGRADKILPMSNLKELSAYLKDCRVKRNLVTELTVTTEPNYFKTSQGV